MEYPEFDALCRETSLQLELPDSDAMSNGGIVFIDGAEVQVLFDETRCCAQFYCELGNPKAVVAAQVYAQLLELQSMFIWQIDAMFVRDPVNDRLLFTVRIPLQDRTADSLATALKTLVGQVRTWQATILAGHLIDYEEEFERLSSEAEPAPLASQFA